MQIFKLKILRNMLKKSKVKVQKKLYLEFV